MKKIITILLTVVTIFAVETLSAQSRTSYFMEGSYFRTEMNPALSPTRGFLALPAMSGVNVGLTGNFLSVDNFIYQRDGGLVTALHSSVSADEFLGRMPNVGVLQLGSDVNILGVGLHSRKMYWTFGANLHVDADVALSKDLFRALKTLGNDVYNLDKVALDVNSYADLYLGASLPIGKHVNFGFRAKFLVGIVNASASFDQISVNVSPDRVDGALVGQWRANGIMMDNTSPDAEGVMDMLRYDDPFFMLTNIKSYGAAIDLGVEVRLLNDHLKVSAAITDLGFIKWAPTSHVGGSVEGDFYFAGVDVESGEIDAAAKIDTEKLQTLDSYEGYTTRLSYDVNVGVEYNFLKNHFALGVLSHTHVGNSAYYTELTASLNIRPTNWITLTASHTFLNGNRPGIFGAAINFHPAAINLYVGMDYIDPNLVYATNLNGFDLYVPRYATSLNVYAGLAFNFGRAKYVRQAAKLERQAKRAL